MFSQSMWNCRVKFVLGVSLSGTNPMSELLICFLAGNIWLKCDSGGWSSFRPVSEILQLIGKRGKLGDEFYPSETDINILMTCGLICFSLGPMPLFSLPWLMVQHIEKRRKNGFESFSWWNDLNGTETIHTSVEIVIKILRNNCGVG